MRTEGNPIKARPELGSYKLHRVIMPVYIPNSTGYYEDAFKIFCLSIESLINTINPELTDITIIDNGSIAEVGDKVKMFITKGQVDQYIQNSQNRGKADAIVAVAKSSYEPLITITDADVMFCSGWDAKSFEVLQTFPNAGMISPFPSPNLALFFTFSTWILNIFRIRKAQIVDVKELNKLEESCGVKLFNSKNYKYQYYVRRKHVTALVGAGHFVSTYRTKIFKKMKYSPSLKGLKGGLRVIDRQVERLGYSKFSLPFNMVIHMGNKYEDWMQVEKAENYLPKSKFINIEKSLRPTKFIPAFVKSIFYKLMKRVV